MKFLTTLDMVKNQLKNFLFHQSSSANLSTEIPTPIAGQSYYNTTENKLYFYDGNSWIDSTDRANHHGIQDMAGGVITNHGSPSDVSDVANKGYVDTIAAGLTPKPAVMVVAIENITPLSGLMTIDGFNLSIDDRVLLTNQTDPNNNGIYIVKSGPWVEVTTETQVPGAFWFVQAGTKFHDTGWVMVNNTPIAEPYLFQQFMGVSTLTGENGIDIVNNQIIKVEDLFLNGSQIKFGINGSPFGMQVDDGRYNELGRLVIYDNGEIGLDTHNSISTRVRNENGTSESFFNLNPVTTTTGGSITLRGTSGGIEFKDKDEAGQVNGFELWSESDKNGKIGTGAGNLELNAANTNIIGNLVLEESSSVTGIIKQGIYNMLNTFANNIFLGRGAGNLTTTGVNNFAVGDQTLIENSNGTNNTAIIAQALNNNTTGSDNIAIGNLSQYNNLDGTDNIALGQYTLSGNSSGDKNIAIGPHAGEFQANGSTPLNGINRSIYIGAESKGFNNSDDNSIVIGYQAVGEGPNTIVLGNDSIVKTSLKGDVVIEVGEIIKQGSYNLIYFTGDNLFGGNAGNSTCANGNNIAFGNGALDSLTDGNDNIALGLNAGSGLTTSDDCICIGANTGGNSNGPDNILIGKNAAYLDINSQVIDGVANCIVIGNNTRLTSPAGNYNAIVIGTNALCKGDSTTVLGNNLTTDTYLFGYTHLRTKIRKVTSSESIVSTDATILADSTSNNINLTLPTPVATINGQVINIKKIVSANSVNIIGTIDGATNLIITNIYDCITLQCFYDGTAADGWYII